MSLPRVVILDLVAPKPYDALTSQEVAQGGTESTVARVAESLAATGTYEVLVAQHNRKEEGRGKAIYCSVEDLEGIHKSPHAVIALRTPKGIPWLKNQWGDSRLFLWCHDENYGDIVAHHEILSETKTKIIGVSRYHKLRIQDALLTQCGFPKGITVDFVYNPIADDLKPSPDRVTDENAFVFFSSPHKGLDHTLEMFKHIRRKWEKSKLYVANPGYYEGTQINMAGVSPLGELAHPEMMKRLETAWCVLHLNYAFPETFGIVHAEAQALGVPVLTSAVGANREILSLPMEQTCYVAYPEYVIERLEKWKRQGRPEVYAKPEFRQSAVTANWLRVLQ